MNFYFGMQMVILGLALEPFAHAELRSLSHVQEFALGVPSGTSAVLKSCAGPLQNHLPTAANMDGAGQVIVSCSLANSPKPQAIRFLQGDTPVSTVFSEQGEFVVVIGHKSFSMAEVTFGDDASIEFSGSRFLPYTGKPRVPFVRTYEPHELAEVDSFTHAQLLTGRGISRDVNLLKLLKVQGPNSETSIQSPLPLRGEAPLAPKIDPYENSLGPNDPITGILRIVDPMNGEAIDPTKNLGAINANYEEGWKQCLQFTGDTFTSLGPLDGDTRFYFRDRNYFSESGRFAVVDYPENVRASRSGSPSLRKIAIADRRIRPGKLATVGHVEMLDQPLGYTYFHRDGNTIILFGRNGLIRVLDLQNEILGNVKARSKPIRFFKLQGYSFWYDDGGSALPPTDKALMFPDGKTLAVVARMGDSEGVSIQQQQSLFNAQILIFDLSGGGFRLLNRTPGRVSLGTRLVANRENPHWLYAIEPALKMEPQTDYQQQHRYTITIGGHVVMTEVPRDGEWRPL